MLVIVECVAQLSIEDLIIALALISYIKCMRKTQLLVAMFRAQLLRYICHQLALRPASIGRVDI